MKIKQADKLKPFKRFMYWIEERHKVYKLKSANKPKPWTDDEVLQTVFFTNPYRENDRTTLWFKNKVRNPLFHSKTVLMATVIFRWFNRIETGRELLNHNLLVNWNEAKAVRLLKKLPKPVFTGAFMIKPGNGPPGSKVNMVCRCISDVWKEREDLISTCKHNSMEQLWNHLIQFRGLGGFMAYEIVCDIRYTGLLTNPPDRNSWANPGPGARRGLFRLAGGKPGAEKIYVKDPIGKMRSLLPEINSELPRGMKRFELREVEHSLCEFDKYEREMDNLLGRSTGQRVKRKYDGT